MSQQDLLKTIQNQQLEINQLREQLSIAQSTNFQIKYRKALKQISGIVKANKQLKEELIKLSNFKNAQNESFGKINKDELGKAYNRILKEKNQLLGQKQALIIQNQRLKQQIIDLQEAEAKLKNQKMALARQKQGAAKLMYLQKSPEGGSNEKQREKDGYYKEKQAELRKTLDNYEERYALLSKTNKKLQQQINELENKLFKVEQQYKTKLNEKDVEVKVSKSAAREDYQNQIASLKRQVNQLKMHNNELQARIGTYQEQRHYGQGQNEYEEQLIETLRQLRSQMEPMSAQIAQLQEKNQFEREQAQRERASLQIKVVQYEAQIERIRESHKLLQQKLIKQTEKSRKWDEAQRTVRKLQEQNRMLGGRIIVLQAKQVALRNRSGDDLQERVLEFQTRVEMLLNDKQTIANMKNIGIHQLIALKTYILQLDSKLKQVVNENQYATKKYKSYKQKCTLLIRELKQHDIAINALKGKLQGYDRLVVKLQGELERAITINDNQMKAINVKISESTMTSTDIYKKRYESLLEKLNLQQKYAQQEIQTLKLNYDTKLLDLNMKLEELSSVRDTIGLYKSKNQQLSNKLTQKQNQLLETKMTKVFITDTIPQPRNIQKDAINKLNETINSKEGVIINLENQLKKLEQQWKGKYTQLEQTTNATLSKKNREEEDKKREIQQLEEQIKSYRVKISELQLKTIGIPSTRKDDDGSSFRQKFTGKISDMQIQLQEMRTKYQLETTKVSKLNKTITDLKQSNGDLQAQISRLKSQIKRLQNELKILNELKEMELKQLQNKGQETKTIRVDSQSNSFKLNSLKMQLQMTVSQVEQLERDKARYYNKTIELESQLAEQTTKIQQLKYALEKSKNTINNDLLLQQTSKDQEIERLQYNLKIFKDKNADLESRISEYQSEISKIKNDFTREKQRLSMEFDAKDEEFYKLQRELNRIRNEVVNQDDIREGIRQQYEFKVNRLTAETTSLKDQIESYHNQIQKLESQLRFFKNRELEYNSKAQGHESYVEKLSNDIKILQNREIELQGQLMDKQTIISKLTNQLTYIRHQIESIESTVEIKENTISRLNNQLITLKNNQFQWELQLSNKQDNTKLASELNYTKNRVAELEEEVQSLRNQVSRLRTQSQLNEQNHFNQTSQIEEKQMIILRLQSDIRSKTDHIHELEDQLNTKNQKINDLQNDSIRYRSMSAQYENDVMDKNQQISRLTYELNNLKTRYENLQQEQQNRDNNWASLNRELATIRAQVGGYEDDLNMKDMTLERYKNDIRELTVQIQKLHEEIFEKNKIINNLNQQLFKLKLETDSAASEQIYKLQNEIYMLKSKVSNLEGELNVKEDELNRAKLEISTVRSNVSANRYSDEEYDLLQTQFYQVQRSLTEVRNQLSEKDLEITQLEAKIESAKRNQAQSKRRWTEERNDMELQMQNILNRERQLRNQLTELQNQAYLSSNRNADEKQFGIQLYQQQCDRLTKITQELQDEVASLKLKLTSMTNQQDRIMQNLTLMTLTFAEVEALRQRMRVKENEISQVRKSLINFASSNEEITSMSSRTLVKEQKQTIQTQTTNLNKPSENAFTTEISYGSRPQVQGGNILYSTEGSKLKAELDNLNNTAIGLENKITYVPQYQSQYSSLRTSNYEEHSYPSVAAVSTSNYAEGYTYQYHPSFNKQRQTDINTKFQQNLQTLSAYGQSNLPYAPRNAEEDQYHMNQNTDRRLHQLASSITGTNQDTVTQQQSKQQIRIQNRSILQQQPNQISQTISQGNVQSQQFVQIQGQNLPFQTNISQSFSPQVNFAHQTQPLSSSLNQQIQSQGQSWRYGSQTQSQTSSQPPSQTQIPGPSIQNQQNKTQSQIKVSFGSNQNIMKVLSPGTTTFSGQGPQIQIQGKHLNASFSSGYAR